MNHITTHRTNQRPFRDEGPHRANAEPTLTDSVSATQSSFGTPSRMPIWAFLLCLLPSSGCGSPVDPFWDAMLWDSRTSFVSILALALAIATFAYIIFTWTRWQPEEKGGKEEEGGYWAIAYRTWVTSILIHIALTIREYWIASTPRSAEEYGEFTVMIIVLVVVTIVVIIIPYMLGSAIVACSYFVLVLPIKRAVKRSRLATKREIEEQKRKIEEQKRKIEEQKRKQKRKIEEHKEYLDQMTHVVDFVPTHIERMNSSLESADTYLRSASSHFSNGAFAPFWDCIVQATCDMGRYQETVRELAVHSSLYARSRSSYSIDVVGKEAPILTLPMSSIGTLKSRAMSTGQRLERIVLTAQSDFEFSVIYEQRRTNDILVAGFGNLENALTNMSRAITGSLQTLDQSIGDLRMDVANARESIDDVKSYVGESIDDVISNVGGVRSSLDDTRERAEENARVQEEAAFESRKRDEEILRIVKRNQEER